MGLNSNARLQLSGYFTCPVALFKPVSQRSLDKRGVTVIFFFLLHTFQVYVFKVMPFAGSVEDGERTSCGSETVSSKQSIERGTDRSVILSFKFHLPSSVQLNVTFYLLFLCLFVCVERWDCKSVLRPLSVFRVQSEVYQEARRKDSHLHQRYIHVVYTIRTNCFCDYLMFIVNKYWLCIFRL